MLIINEIVTENLIKCLEEFSRHLKIDFDNSNEKFWKFCFLDGGQLLNPSANAVLCNCFFFSNHDALFKFAVKTCGGNKQPDPVRYALYFWCVCSDNSESEKETRIIYGETCL